jgi:hypothetical protein
MEAVKGFDSLLGCDWSCVAFLAIGISISFLVALAEVIGGFMALDAKYPWAKVLLNRWSMMFFAFYGLFTLLVGILVLEQQLVTPSYTTGLILGFLGISVLKIQITLFKPLTGSEGLTAKFDQVFGGIQQFCFDGLLRSLEVKRQDIRERAARLGETALMDKLKDLIPNEMDTVNKLVDGNRETNPETIPALLVSLIERHNPDQLEILVNQNDHGDSDSDPA